MKNKEYYIKEGANKLGISLSRRQVLQFLKYLEVLERWNERINLTSITDDRGIIIRHFLDSVAGLAAFPEGESIPAAKAPGGSGGENLCRVIDVGTGAGFPGIPIKICRPDISLTLLESKEKKAAFLHSVCGLIGLEHVEIIRERLEVILTEKLHRGAYDFLLSRALNPVMVLKLAPPLLRKGGRVILWATRVDHQIESEIKGSGNWASSEIIPYQLPFEGLERKFIRLEKADRSS